MKSILLSIVILFVISLSINSATINVPADQPTIQAGIDASVNGDTVLVAAGTYSGIGNEDIDFKVKEVLLKSTSGSDSTFINALTGNGFFSSLPNSSRSMIEGFRISGAQYSIVEFGSITIIDCVCDSSITILGNSIDTSFIIRTEINKNSFNAGYYSLDSCFVNPGVILNFDFNSSSISITNCIFDSSGIYVENGSLLKIDNCEFYSCPTALTVDLSNGTCNNSTFIDNKVVSVIRQSSLKFNNCYFKNNSNIITGSIFTVVIDSSVVDSAEYLADQFDSGSIRISNSEVKNLTMGFIIGIGDGIGANLTNCEIHDNKGIFLNLTAVDNNAWLSIDSCRIYNNDGGIYIRNIGSFELINSIYYNNFGDIDLNGPIFNQALINNSSIVNNHPNGIYSGVSNKPLNITNSIVANNFRGIEVGNGWDTTLVNISCSNIFGNDINYVGLADQTGLNNNISLDPMFCDTVNNDYFIYDNSPCAPSNNACSTLMGAFGVGCIYPIIDTIFILNEESLHVLNHNPEISWSFSNSTIQTDFEIAVGSDNDWAFAEMWNPAPMTSPDTFITYNGSTLIDGETYYGRLKVSNGTAWSDWFEFSFRMNSKPTTPITISPINDTLTNSIPTLWIQNSSDAEGDSLFYDFSGNKFTGTGLVFEPLLVGNNIVEDSDSTGLAVTFPLEENSLFYWEVRAFDGYEYSDWTTLLESSFWVNDVNEAPSAPVTVTPNETSSPLYNMQPTFNWTESIDVDPFDTVHYKLHLAIDSNFTFETLIDLLPQNSYTLTFPLDYKENYWWKVEAVDLLGGSTVSNRLHFWTSCCIGIRGNVNNDVNDDIDISDLVFLVAYMFQGGATPTCMDEADINGSGGETPIDISDLVALVAFMFQGGAPPTNCP